MVTWRSGTQYCRTPILLLHAVPCPTYVNSIEAQLAVALIFWYLRLGISRQLHESPKSWISGRSSAPISTSSPQISTSVTMWLRVSSTDTETSPSLFPSSGGTTMVLVESGLPLVRTRRWVPRRLGSIPLRLRAIPSRSHTAFYHPYPI
jgi:hypothetical protein